MTATILFHSPIPQCLRKNRTISHSANLRICTLFPNTNLAFSLRQHGPFVRNPFTISMSNNQNTSEYDIVVVGSGLGGLSAAALLSATYGKSVCVCESHTHLGGAAHSFTRNSPAGKFVFHSGPHLYSGLSTGGIDRKSVSCNPMQHVLLAIGAHLPCVSYDSWGCFFPEGYFSTRVSPSRPLFEDLIGEVSGPHAQQQVANLLKAMRPLCKLATALPPAALRADDLLGSIRVGLKYAARNFSLDQVPQLPKLSKPFEPLLNEFVQDSFAKNFIDLLCFLLAGVPANRIPTAEVAFMFGEWMGLTAGSLETDSVLEHPLGGAGAIVDELVKAIERNNQSSVRTNAHVDQILLDADAKTVKGSSTTSPRVKGIRLRSGERVIAREAVISNVSGWDFPKLLEKAAENEGETPSFDCRNRPTPPEDMCPSFMHLHMAFKLTDKIRASLPHEMEPNYVSVEDWSKGLTSPGNVVLISIPSVIDQTVAPSGYVSLHAYTPATEPYEIWSKTQRGTNDYNILKQERSEVLWRAIERIIPNAREIPAEMRMIGTPLTHEHFLRRSKGTYGPAVDASRNSISLGLPFPSRSDIAYGLFTVGDATFPGIGVPAVAASAWLAANALVDINKHAKALEKIGL